MGYLIDDLSQLEASKVPYYELGLKEHVPN